MSTAIYNSQDWVGKQFNMLSVIEPVHANKQWMWRVRCDCGEERIYVPHEVISGKVKSCGCYRKSGKQTPRVHGESHTRLHDTWTGMNNRCNPQNKNSERYGVRGIKVCEEWKDYTKFAEWARNNGFREDLTIERVDVNGDYCPDNCTWIPLSKQARNRRTTRWVEYQGRTMSLAEAAEIAGLLYKQVHARVKKGLDLERALSEPLHQESELHIKCREAGVNYHTVYNRILRGWSEELALNTPSLGRGANQTTYKTKNKEEQS